MKFEISRFTYIRILYIINFVRINHRFIRKRRTKCNVTKDGACDVLSRNGIWFDERRGIVQLVERWSPKPNVEGSSPSAPGLEEAQNMCFFFYVDF